MTRAPLRGGDLRGVDLVLASHKHSDHLDPGTLPDLMAASPGAVLVLPEAILDHAVQTGPARRAAGRDRRRATRGDRPGSGSAPSPRPTSGSTATPRAASLPGVRHRVRRACRLYHSGDSLAYEGLAERAGDRAVRRAVPADQRPGPGAGRAGQHDGGRGGRPGDSRSGRGSSCRIITICSLSTRFPSRCSRPRPAGCRRGSRRESCDAASAGRSRREHHAGDRHRDLGDQDAGDRRAGDDPRLGVGRVSLRPPQARAGPSRTPSSGGTPRSRRAGTCWPRASSRRPTWPGSA